MMRVMLKITFPGLQTGPINPLEKNVTRYDDVIQRMVVTQEISSKLSFRFVVIATIEFGLPGM